MTPSDPTTASPAALLHTPLHALHLELGAKMVPFAGYAMPVSYPQGILAEHRQCRESAVLFDVSHMGQLRLTGDDAAAALETLVPVDIVGLAPGKQRYALFTNDAGGILDDLMVTRRDDHLFLVVNAACKEADTAHLRAHLSTRCLIEPLPERALLALQGPKAAAVMARLAPELAQAHLHDRRRGDDPRHRLLRHPLRLHRRGRLRDLGRRAGSGRRSPARCSPSPKSRPPASARATRCGSRRACASTATTSTPPPRRSRPASPGRSRRCAGPAASAPAAIRAPTVIAAQLADGAPTKRVGLVGLERVPVREGAHIVDDAGARDRPRHQRHGRAERRPADRHGLRAERARRAGHRASMPTSAASASRCASPPAVRAASLLPRLSSPLRPLQEQAMTVKYTDDHEWISFDEAGPATVGITQHAQDALGDVVFVDLPAVGKTFAKGDVAGVVESVKAAADLYMPVGGEVVEVNEALRADPSLANSDPQASGWFFKVKVADPGETDALLDQGAYDELVKNA